MVKRPTSHLLRHEESHKLSTVSWISLTGVNGGRGQAICTHGHASAMVIVTGINTPLTTWQATCQRKQTTSPQSAVAPEQGPETTQPAPRRLYTPNAVGQLSVNIPQTHIANYAIMSSCSIVLKQGCTHLRSKVGPAHNGHDHHPERDDLLNSCGIQGDVTHYDT